MPTVCRCQRWRSSAHRQSRGEWHAHDTSRRLPNATHLCLLLRLLLVTLHSERWHTHVVWNDELALRLPRATLSRAGARVQLSLIDARTGSHLAYSSRPLADLVRQSIQSTLWDRLDEDWVFASSGTEVGGAERVAPKSHQPIRQHAASPHSAQPSHTVSPVPFPVLSPAGASATDASAASGSGAPSGYARARLVVIDLVSAFDELTIHARSDSALEAGHARALASAEAHVGALQEKLRAMEATRVHEEMNHIEELNRVGAEVEARVRASFEEERAERGAAEAKAVEARLAEAKAVEAKNEEARIQLQAAQPAVPYAAKAPQPVNKPQPAQALQLAQPAKPQAAKVATAVQASSAPATTKADLTEAQIEELREAFYLFDTDNSGDIDSSELGAAMSALGFTVDEVELQQMIAEVDSDGSGEISFDEVRRPLPVRPSLALYSPIYLCQINDASQQSPPNHPLPTTPSDPPVCDDDDGEDGRQVRGHRAGGTGGACGAARAQRGRANQGEGNGEAHGTRDDRREE